MALFLYIYLCIGSNLCSILLYPTQGGGSFLSNNTDDDDISVFVQEIDARKPLSGHQRIRSHDRDTSDPGRRLGGGGEDKPIAGLLSTEEGLGPGASSS